MTKMGCHLPDPQVEVPWSISEEYFISGAQIPKLSNTYPTYKKPKSMEMHLTPDILIWGD